MVSWDVRQVTSRRKEWAISLYASRQCSKTRILAFMVSFRSIEVSGDLYKIDFGGVVRTETRLEGIEGCIVGKKVHNVA